MPGENDQTLTLDTLANGKSARVARLLLEGPERRRLMDLGFMPGVEVTAELENPFGDPRAFRLMGGLVAVRRQQARQIEIEPLRRNEP